MPQQEPYTIILDDSSTITLQEDQLPAGFDTFNAVKKDSVARNIVIEHLNELQAGERPATFRDFAWPLAILFTLSIIILLVAKKIRNNPKVYDNVVKLDGKPNEEYGKDWEK